MSKARRVSRSLLIGTLLCVSGSARADNKAEKDFDLGNFVSGLMEKAGSKLLDSATGQIGGMVFSFIKDLVFSSPNELALARQAIQADIASLRNDLDATIRGDAQGLIDQITDTAINGYTPDPSTLAIWDTRAYEVEGQLEAILDQNVAADATVCGPVLNVLAALHVDVLRQRGLAGNAIQLLQRVQQRNFRMVGAWATSHYDANQTGKPTDRFNATLWSAGLCFQPSVCLANNQIFNRNGAVAAIEAAMTALMEQGFRTVAVTNNNGAPVTLLDAIGPRDSIALTGGPQWASIPIAWSQGGGAFRIYNTITSSPFPGWASRSDTRIFATTLSSSPTPLPGSAPASLIAINGANTSSATLGGPLGTWFFLDAIQVTADGVGSFVDSRNSLSSPGTYPLQFPRWSTMDNVYSVTGDFDGDGVADLALLGGSGWDSIPVYFTQGPTHGAWIANVTITQVINAPGLSPSAGTNFARWAQIPGARAVAGDFNGDGKADIALMGFLPLPNGGIPVAVSRGDGTFSVSNGIGSSDFGQWAAEPNVIPVAGNFNDDNLADIALVGRDGWNTIPVAFHVANAGLPDGFTRTNFYQPDFAFWASRPNVKPVAGDYNGDGRTDIALVGGGNWVTIPVATSMADGTFAVSNRKPINPEQTFPDWAQLPGVKAYGGRFAKTPPF